MKEKLQEYALIAEVISALGIIISLIFVGIQVAQNTQATKASTYQSMIDLSHERMRLLTENREITKLIVQGQNKDIYLNLDPVDQLRLFVLDRDGWRILENAFVQYSRGVIGEGEWSGYRSMMCGETLASDSMNYFWDSHKINLSPDFVRFIESCRKSE